MTEFQINDVRYKLLGGTFYIYDGIAWTPVFGRESALLRHLATIQMLVDGQSEDDSLWFEAQTAPEAYLQQELRKLHAVIEEALP